MPVVQTGLAYRAKQVLNRYHRVSRTVLNRSTRTVLVPSGVADASHRRRPGRAANSQVAVGDWAEPEGTAAPPLGWKHAPNTPVRGLLPT
eukprot:7568968-Pyramimonas_sp.AAC.1